MSSFSTYNTLMSDYLANSSQNFYTPQMRLAAINQAARDIAKNYDVKDLRTRPSGGTISFTSGVADFPSDYLKMDKLWKVDANGKETARYEYIYEDQFDSTPSTAAYYWSDMIDVSDGERKLHILPSSTTVASMRYYKYPQTLTETGTDTGFSSHWDESIAAYAVHILLRNAGRYDESQLFKQEATRLIGQVYTAIKNEGGVKHNARLRSKWERQSLLNR